MEIIDDYLPYQDFRKLKSFIGESSWKYEDDVETPFYRFTERLGKDSPSKDLIPLLNKLDIKRNESGEYPEIDEMKSVLLPKTFFKRGTGYTTGIPKDYFGATVGMKTALYYINSNNGYTYFKNSNDKVKSVENRMIIFDSNWEYSHFTCTDEKIRLYLICSYTKVLNITEAFGLSDDVVNQWANMTMYEEEDPE